MSRVEGSSLTQIFKEHPKRAASKAIVTALVVIAICSGFTGSLPVVASAGGVAGAGLIGYQVANAKGSGEPFLFTPLEDEEKRPKGGDTRLMHAVREGNFARVQHLLYDEEGEDRNAINPLTEETALDITTDPQIIALLKGEKIPYRFRNVYEWDTALTAAVKTGDLARVKKVLYEVDYDLNQPMRVTKDTPLHIAVREGHYEIAAYLLEQMAIMINLQNVNKLTPLHYAARNGDVEMIQLLLRHGADRTMLDEQDKTPYQLALDHNCDVGLREVAQWFRV